MNSKINQNGFLLFKSSRKFYFKYRISLHGLIKKLFKHFKSFSLFLDRLRYNNKLWDKIKRINRKESSFLRYVENDSVVATFTAAIKPAANHIAEIK